jgi:acyl-CoA dehydrogenase
MLCPVSTSAVARRSAPIADQGVVRTWTAESQVKLKQLRLLVLKTAWLMDTVGDKGAHTEIRAIKITTPETVQWILDKAIQVHGARGLSGRSGFAAHSSHAREIAERPGTGSSDLDLPASRV